jgi:hypothetical protein
VSTFADEEAVAEPGLEKSVLGALLQMGVAPQNHLEQSELFFARKKNNSVTSTSRGSINATPSLLPNQTLTTLPFSLAISIAISNISGKDNAA